MRIGVAKDSQLEDDQGMIDVNEMYNSRAISTGPGRYYWAHQDAAPPQDHLTAMDNYPAMMPPYPPQAYPPVQPFQGYNLPFYQPYKPPVSYRQYVPMDYAMRIGVAKDSELEDNEGLIDVHEMYNSRAKSTGPGQNNRMQQGSKYPPVQPYTGSKYPQVQPYTGYMPISEFNTAPRTGQNLAAQPYPHILRDFFI
uniref:Uncharacterized protein n=1 Tax=Pseudodiaptomus poplesia TaxID=213370 RepID=A0A0U2THD8_9MAXI|nr:hypothetical protein [Pseudodiaptomus poplesia]